MNMINQLFYRGFAVCIVTSTILSSCAKFETLDFKADKPESVVQQEVLDAYDDLKTYVDRSSQADFRLGVELGLNDVINNSLLYRLAQRNFDEINFTAALNHMGFVQTDGNIALGRFQQFLDLNSSVAAMPIHAGHLVWHEKQQSTYLKNLIADIIIPGESGIDIVADFEENDLGDAYPMSNGGSSSIVMDPTGDSGKSLNIKGAQTFPQFQVTLPEGRTLGDYTNVTIDFRGAGCCGLYGGGMRMAISTSIGPVTITNYSTGPSGFGIGDNVWGRGKIILSLSNLNLSTAQKELTSFVLTVGSGTGSADYLIDNVSMAWEKAGQTIVKTPEEKAEIITAELDKWIKGLGELGKDRVQSWSVIYQPIDEVNTTELRSGLAIDPMPANTFYWQDYLGKDYAGIAIGLLKQYVNPTDKIYFTETNLLDNPSKIQGLMDLISHTESKGQQVDGIATELALDATTINRDKIETMFVALANTGKLIKISALDIGIGGKISQATTALYQQQANEYKWFIETYYRLIPANQRGGISFRSPIDQIMGAPWRPEEPVGLWTSTASYIRKLAYEGIVKAFEGLK